MHHPPHCPLPAEAQHSSAAMPRCFTGAHNLAASCMHPAAMQFSCTSCTSRRVGVLVSCPQDKQTAADTLQHDLQQLPGPGCTWSCWSYTAACSRGCQGITRTNISPLLRPTSRLQRAHGWIMHQLPQQTRWQHHDAATAVYLVGSQCYCIRWPCVKLLHLKASTQKTLASTRSLLVRSLQ